MAMSFLSMMEAKLPPGFRFHPRDEELIDDYLANRITGDQSNGCPMLVDVDLNKVEPWDLPDYACVGRKDWYFYSQRDKKYATGQRTNRATLSGYWKATGKDRQVADGRKGGKLVGMRKTLVFYKGRAPKGKKTDWVMHEFRMEGDRPKPPPSYTTTSSSSSSSSAKEDWVLCRVFYKSRGISLKPSTTENCYDDTGSSSLPPLMDTYINFEQPPQPLNEDNNNNNNNNNSNSNNNNNNNSSNLHGFNEQVPCFSNLRHSVAATAFNHLLPPPLPPPLVDTNLLPNKSLPPPSASQLGGLPGMGAYMNPLMSFSCEKKAIKAVLDHISKAPEARSLAENSESFLREAGAHSMWNPF